MKDLAHRFPSNPILKPTDLFPSNPALKVICLLNPGVFRFQGKTWLLVRVAESKEEKDGTVFFPMMNDEGITEVMEIAIDDPDLIAHDPRVMNYRGLDYLTTISHFRLLSSHDGIHFSEDPHFQGIFGRGELERFGIEDCRVAEIDGVFYLSYTSVSASGVGVGVTYYNRLEKFFRTDDDAATPQ